MFVNGKWDPEDQGEFHEEGLGDQGDQGDRTEDHAGLVEELRVGLTEDRVGPGLAEDHVGLVEELHVGLTEDRTEDRTEGHEDHIEDHIEDRVGPDLAEGLAEDLIVEEDHINLIQKKLKKQNTYLKKLIKKHSGKKWKQCEK